jgi:hypothetical protein
VIATSEDEQMDNVPNNDDKPVTGKATNKKRALKIVCWTLGAVLLYLLSYGIIHRMGDNSVFLRKTASVIYYPVNCLRINSDFIYVITESLYKIAGGSRSEDSRAQDWGYQRIWFKFSDSESNYIYRNGALQISRHYDQHGNLVKTIREVDSSVITEYYYPNGQCAFMLNFGKEDFGKAYWDDGTLFAEFSYIRLGKVGNGLFPKCNNKNGKHTLVIDEYRDGVVVKRITDDFSSLGGSPEKADAFFELYEREVKKH